MAYDNQNRFTFTVSLADVPIQITCRCMENRDFLKEYLTGQAALFSVEPGEEDLERIREGLRQTDAGGDLAPEHFPDCFLENNAIHALIAEKLIDYHILLMHGSALCMDGKAYIFTAPSGTGKSTHARLWRETFGDRVWMINDDKPLVRIEGGTARVYGSPWDGKHHLSRNASAPLKAVLRIVRSEENRLEPMSKADALQMLLQQVYSSDFPDSARRVFALKAAMLDTNEILK